MVDKTHLRQLAKGLQTVPNSATDLTTKNAWVYQIVVANTNSSAVTLTIKDKAATPLELVPTVSLGQNSVTILSFPKGVLMTGGINWQAGTADKLRAEVDAYVELN